ncbi:hypothetical protein RUE5091_02756 [Ruegeria denitrificans]|uniref:Uncharacterized protein n=1 Tax=Ruegeria denitrificans TaxID=1715692 RepID=A0A0N7MA04_9RHOB|nr:hypothetical protein RUE5091_02756 [Ruegeria denitrificans]
MVPLLQLLPVLAEVSAQQSDVKCLQSVRTGHSIL